MYKIEIPERHSATNRAELQFKDTQPESEETSNQEDVFYSKKFQGKCFECDFEGLPQEG